MYAGKQNSGCRPAWPGAIELAASISFDRLADAGHLRFLLWLLALRSALVYAAGL